MPFKKNNESNVTDSNSDFDNDYKEVFDNSEDKNLKEDFDNDYESVFEEEEENNEV